MIELSQHIEALLLENDCVIVPGLGGFVAHYTSATRIEEESLFLPPTRIIGFNPQLTMNDGVLVQSYMAVYNTSFADATRIIERKVEDIFATLHEEGKLDLPNVGELRYSIYGTYEFIPYDDKITSPYLYGLDSFEMKKLSALTQTTGGKLIPLTPAIEGNKKRNFEIKINRSYLSNAVAMIAAVVLFFLLSTPLENTEVLEGNYAQLLPGDLFKKIEKQSLAFTPIVSKTVKNKKNPVALAPAKPEVMANVSRPVTAVTQTVDAPEIVKPVPPPLPYHIIVASVGTEKDAQLMAEHLIQKGFSGAKAIIGDGKMRVSILSCSTEAEVYQALTEIRKNEAYQNAWVLKK
ncbi:sporulation related protein [Bacteroides zoogleoformans]|uniref:Cell division protein n=1 Tax=Bacteroides zoogleoformans TaxID=28119 RepID=A0ABM6T518_9BACE|nr:SPOR domain-containing protein [Bacteroides zoogleoformans]AVM51795.1 cell division protein [Bacteroides zoogleoformans]TWJ13257.1 sporulation related protein [Bacteroides zoogleoformans]